MWKISANKTLPKITNMKEFADKGYSHNKGGGEEACPSILHTHSSLKSSTSCIARLQGFGSGQGLAAALFMEAIFIKDELFSVC